MLLQSGEKRATRQSSFLKALIKNHEVRKSHCSLLSARDQKLQQNTSLGSPAQAAGGHPGLRAAPGGRRGEHPTSRGARFGGSLGGRHSSRSGARAGRLPLCGEPGRADCPSLLRAPSARRPRPLVPEAAQRRPAGLPGPQDTHKAGRCVPRSMRATAGKASLRSPKAGPRRHRSDTHSPQRHSPRRRGAAARLPATVALCAGAGQPLPTTGRAREPPRAGGPGRWPPAAAGHCPVPSPPGGSASCPGVPCQEGLGACPLSGESLGRAAEATKGQFA